MFPYEIFRQSIIGWAGLTAFTWVAYTRLGALDLNSTFVVFATAFVSGPAFGYMIAQLNRLYYRMFHRRPNDQSASIVELHKAAQAAIDDPVLAPLARMEPKALERFLWVTLANTELRARAESYWERYYTNVCMTIASAIGALCGVAFVIYRSHSLHGVEIHADEGGWGGARLAVIVLLDIALLVVAQEYRAVANGIEDAWNASLAARWGSDRARLRAALIR